MIGSPSPPAPTKAARVAVPMLMMAAVLMPARMVGMARGSSTFLSCCAVVSPMLPATSLSSGSTLNSPVSVLRTMGSRE